MEKEDIEKRKICILCKSKTYLQAAEKCIRNLRFIKENSYDIKSAHVGVLNISEAHFQNAQLVILLAVPEPRALIISTEEASQLGLAYQLSMELKRKVIVIVAVQGREELQDSEAVHQSFLITISSQPQLLELYKRRRVMSVAYDAFRNKEMLLNKTQEHLLQEWAESDDSHNQIQDAQVAIQRSRDLGESSSSTTAAFIKLHQRRTKPEISEKILLKVAHNYLAKYRHIILWGSGVNPETRNLHDFYTDIAWKVSQSDKGDRKNKYLEHYTDMLKKDSHSPNRRICVWGDAGVGKSVFVAKLCQDWALVKTNEKQRASFQFSEEQRKTLSNISEDQREILENIELLLCFILRDIKTHQNIKDMIKMQLNLDENQGKVICDFIDEYPANVVMALDGLDEIKLSRLSEVDAYDQLFDILEGKTHPQVGYIVTCRPFAAYNIKLNVDAQVELTGFSEVQAKNYVNNYYLRKFPEKSDEQNKKEANELWKKICGSHDLYEMALNPSMLQLICLLYTKTGKLGNDKTQIFKDYTRYLLTQYHIKVRPRQNFKEEFYKEDLMKIGELALSGLQFSHLQLIFKKKEIESVLGDKPFEMGFVTELPSNQLAEPKVQFLHKSLQEYLAAFFIINSPQEESIAHLMQFCSTSTNMMGSQIILSFISVMSKGLGKIVQRKVLEMISEWENKGEVAPAERLKFLYTMLKTDKKLTFPLPKEIDIDIEDYEPYTNFVWHNIRRFFMGPSTLERLFGMDSSGVIKIKMIVGGNTRLQLLKTIQGKQLKHLELDFNGTSQTDDGPCLQNIFSKNKGILDLKLVRYGQNDEHAIPFGKNLTKSINFLQGLQRVDISDMKMGSNTCCLLVQEIIKQRLPLEYLDVSGNSRKDEDKDTALGNILIEAALKLPQHFQVNATGMGKDAEVCAILINKVSKKCQISTCNEDASRHKNNTSKGILKEDLPNPFKESTKYHHLTLSGFGLNSNISKALLSKIPLLCSKLHCCNISGHDLTGGGLSLAMVLNKCSLLTVLEMDNCNLQRSDVQQMAANLKKMTNIIRLGLSRNVGLNGAEVGQLVSRCPDLRSLDISKCGLKDVEQMVANMQRSTKITTLSMAWSNNLTGAGVGQLVSHCPDLRSLDLGSCGLRGADVEQMVANMPHTTKISTLRMAGNINLTGAGGGQLVSHCPDLRTLDLGSCGLRGADVEQMVANMPHSTNIIALRLAENNLFGGEAALGRLLQRLPALQILDVYWCRLHIPDLLRAAGRDALTNMRFLDLGWNSDPQLEVSGYLASMPRLQALSVAPCGCNDVQDLLRLVASLPPTLTHLNVCNNYFDPSVVEVLQHKERLARLHRLNIGTYSRDDKVRIIRGELQRLNPQLLVYYDKEERLWDMYKDGTQDT